MEAAEIPNLVLIASVLCASISKDYGAACLEDPTDCPPFIRDRIWLLYLGIFAALGACAIFLWSFFYANWWEPIASLFFVLMVLAPITSLLVQRSDVLFFFSFLLAGFLGPGIAIWVLWQQLSHF